MERIERIVNNPEFRRQMEAIVRAEQNRIFCGHSIHHSMDVARIAYIINLDEKLGLQKSVIYATALLHDIGRGKEYAGGGHHNVAGTKLAERILTQSGFTPGEIAEIVTAIHGHCSKDISKLKGERSLTGLLVRADKLSRLCFMCEARSECYWPEDIKNRRIEI